MSAYEEIWGVAEDNFGLITSKKAVELGISRQCLRSMTDTGRLYHVGHGVYQVLHHVHGRLDPFAASVAMVGESAYLRGASVVALLELCPTNPGVMYVGCDRRVRRRLPRGFRVKDRTASAITEFEGCEGIRCQPLVEALRAARDEGAIEADRIADAAEKAKEKGLLSDEECAEFKSQS